MDSPYLSVAEVAHLLGRTPKWVYENKGVIPGFFKLGGSNFFDRDVLVSGLKNAATRPAKSQKPDSRNDRHGLCS